MPLVVVPSSSICSITTAKSNPLMPATPELAQYTTDFGVWVPPDGASVGVEAASLNGKIILCIHNKAPNPGLADILRKTFENEGVAVLEAEDLD